MVFNGALGSKDFYELTLPHQRMLYNYALKLTRNKHDAEDLLQETIYRAFKNFRQLREKSRLKGWLISILRNHYCQEWKKKQSFKCVDIDDQTGYIESLITASPKNNPEEELIKQTKEEEVRSVVDKLPEKYKSPLVLSYTDGLSYKEIAHALDMPIGTVMSRISRAKAFVKKELMRLSLTRQPTEISLLDFKRTQKRRQL